MPQDFAAQRIQDRTSGKIPALKHLNALVGEWNTKITDPSDPDAFVFGTSSFDWLPGEYFMEQNWEVASVDLPSGLAIISWSTITQNFSMHYYDSRGISRIYEMGLRDGIWKLWRVMPGYSQRFLGTFSEDGKVIRGAWEKSVDESTWEHDFDITYTRVEDSPLVHAALIQDREKIDFSESYR